jgi:acetyl esterase/lipase
MLGLDARYLEEAGVDPSRIRAVAGIAGPYDFLPLTPDMDGVFGQARDLALTQPVDLVRPDAPPMLLVTGEADAVVAPANTAALARALRSVGAKVEEQHYAGVGHNEIMAAMSRPFRGRAPVLDDVSEFLMREATEP